MGAGGRDFHDFNTVFRGDPGTSVVAFTAAQIPGIADRRYPTSLSGPGYPDGIPIRAERELEAIIRDEHVDEVVFAYSDLTHLDVMHLASRVMAAGADFRLLGPHETMLRSTKPVIAVCATRTGCGKSQTSRRLGRLLLDAGFEVALVRHPMPYGDLERMRVQRFETLADIDASDPTIEEREEYEAPVRMGMVTWAGVDYAEILRRAEREADVVIWDGGNNDFSFFAADLYVTVADPLRPGHELLSHPGEVNLRLADVVVVNKVDSAKPADVETVVRNVEAVNPHAAIVRAASPVTVDEGPPLVARRVVVVEDGPTITHGGMPFGAGTVAAQRAGALIVDPHRFAVGTMRETLERFPHIGPVLPAMGYSDEQLADLEATLRAIDCDAVLAGTPIDLAHLVDAGKPIRRVTYELQEVESPTLSDLLAPYLEKWAAARHAKGSLPGAHSRP
jgi:predicted GTPase